MLKNLSTREGNIFIINRLQVDNEIINEQTSIQKHLLIRILLKAVY